MSDLGALLAIGISQSSPGAEVDKILNQINPGGVILFRRNITDPENLKALIEQIKNFQLPDGNRPLVMVDHEGGLVHRFGPFVPRTPSAMAMGATHNADLTYKLGKAVGKILHLWGFDSPLAPVLDIDPIGINPQLLTRTFSADPQEVSIHGLAWIEGLIRGGVAPCGKHFPGLGRASRDTHFGQVLIEGSEDALLSDLQPFQHCLKALPMIMTSHAIYQNIDPDLPATLSSATITTLLRNRLSYPGMILTDDLSMGAITSFLPPGKAALMAIKAGCNLILMCKPGSGEIALESLQKASKDSDLDHLSIHNSLKLRNKLIRNLDSMPPMISPSLIEEDIELAATNIAKAALTKLQGDGEISPLGRGSVGILDLTGSVATPAVTNPDSPGRKLADLIPKSCLLTWRQNIPVQDRIILLLGSQGIPDGFEIDQIKSSEIYIISLGVPHGLGDLKGIRIKLATYSSDRASLEHLAHTLVYGGYAPGRRPGINRRA